MSIQSNIDEKRKEAADPHYGDAKKIVGIAAGIGYTITTDLAETIWKARSARNQQAVSQGITWMPITKASIEAEISSYFFIKDNIFPS